jgi:hypothetical protein
VQAEWLAEMDQDGTALQALAEATSICWERLPQDDQPSCAARAFLLQGRLLARQSRYAEAASPLARGWHLASGGQEGQAAQVVQALRDTYRADQPALVRAWRAETGQDPPAWLTGHSAS